MFAEKILGFFLLSQCNSVVGVGAGSGFKEFLQGGFEFWKKKQKQKTVPNSERTNTFAGSHTRPVIIPNYFNFFHSDNKRVWK